MKFVFVFIFVTCLTIKNKTMDRKVQILKIEANPFKSQGFALYENGDPLYLIEGFRGNFYIYNLAGNMFRLNYIFKLIYNSRTGLTSTAIYIIPAKYLICEAHYIPHNTFYVPFTNEFIEIREGGFFTCAPAGTLSFFVGNSLDCIHTYFKGDSDKPVLPPYEYKNLPKDLKKIDNNNFIFITYNKEKFLIDKNEVSNILRKLKEELKEYDWGIEQLPQRCQLFLKKLSKYFDFEI